MAINEQLFQEILTNDGQDAALKYLIEKEGLDYNEAMIKIVPPTTVEDKLIFEHYCMRDNEMWIGNTKSLCPICGTDGLTTDTLPVNSDKGFKVSFYTKVQLMKKWIMSKGTS